MEVDHYFLFSVLNVVEGKCTAIKEPKSKSSLWNYFIMEMPLISQTLQPFSLGFSLGQEYFYLRVRKHFKTHEPTREGSRISPVMQVNFNS